MRPQPLQSSSSHNRPELKAGLLLVLLACAGCFGQGPTASRIRPDTHDRFYPQRDIHFVEHGHRSKGVLVSATAGFDSPFSASWVTMLVPTPPSALTGPSWTGRRAKRDQAVAIAGLPSYRNSFYAVLYGNSVRFRFRESAVWILSTDPLIIGLPDGDPKQSWREFAALATGVRDAEHLEPVDTLLARYVVDEELNQPLARLVVFRPDFWNGGSDEPRNSNGIRVRVVTLPKPLSINQLLNALEGDPQELGTVETVDLSRTLRLGQG
jgi:hypothetical protein